MRDQKINKIYNIVLVSTLVVPSLSSLYGCVENQGYAVLASTGTVIGVEVSQNTATQTPQAKLGYNRAELAFVPTNRDGGKEAGTSHSGARDSANVLMELRYGSIFDLGKSSGIYQRLAVGDIAVTQQGAAVMFAKNADGALDEKAKDALSMTKFDNAVKQIDPRYTSYKDFAIDPGTSLEKIKAVCLLLKNQGETLTCN